MVQATKGLVFRRITRFEPPHHEQYF